VADEVEQCPVDLVCVVQIIACGPPAMTVERAFFSNAGSLRLVASQGRTRSWSPWITRTGMLIVARSPRKSSRQAVTQRRAVWADVETAVTNVILQAVRATS
jgi:hypothetical protein